MLTVLDGYHSGSEDSRRFAKDGEVTPGTARLKRTASLIPEKRPSVNNHRRSYHV
jgi:hypothetical protein